MQYVDQRNDPRQLTSLQRQIHVDSWSPDGRLLSVHQHNPGGPQGILLIPMDRPESPARPIFGARNFNDDEGAVFSPDNRYVAYQSSQAGPREVYVRLVDTPGAETTVSVGGGREPVWGANGELFYRSPAGDRMMAVTVSTQPALRMSSPREIFRGPYPVVNLGGPQAQYDVTADGSRFLMPSPVQEGPVRVYLVQNWTEELKRLVPAN